jgi:hypothetical protein
VHEQFVCSRWREWCETRGAEGSSGAQAGTSLCLSVRGRVRSVRLRVCRQAGWFYWRPRADRDRQGGGQ